MSSAPLKAAGLTRINVHVDTFHPERLKKIMRFGSREEIEAGIAAAEAAGLLPLKVNVVVTRDYNDMDVADIARRALDRGWQVRFIELMPLGGGETARLSLSQFVPSRETRERIEAEFGPLIPVPGPSSCVVIPRPRGSLERGHLVALEARRHAAAWPGRAVLERDSHNSTLGLEKGQGNRVKTRGVIQ